MRNGEELAALLATGRCLALIGFMTAGKSRVGAELSRLCGWPATDLDEEIERTVGLPVHRIFETCGERFFRDAETAALRHACGEPGRILACGGGTILRPENRAVLAARCVRVWLQVSPPEVLARLRQPDAPRRPLLEGKDLPALVTALLREREPYYRASDLAVETDGRGVTDIAREILRRLDLPERPV